MSYFRVPKNTSLLLNILLSDGNTGKYPLAFVYSSEPSSLTPVTGSPFTLTSVGNGLYSNHAVTVPEGRYIAVSVVYNDAGHTQVSSSYGRSMDVYDVTDIVDVNAISEGVWKETLSGNTLAGTFGKALSDALEEAVSANTQASTLLSRLTAIRASNLDKIDTNLSGIPSGVWNALRSSHTASGSFGEAVDAKISSRESDTSAMGRFSGISTQLDGIEWGVSNLDSKASAIKTKTDNLQFSGSNVMAKAVEVSDKSGYALSLSGVSSVASSVWNETLPSNPPAGSTGDALYKGVVDLTSIADAVWDENRDTHTSSGTFGEASQGVLSPARANNLDNLNIAVSSLQTESSAINRHNESLAKHLNTLNAITSVSSKVGNPSGSSVCADLASVKSDTAKIGTPSSGTIASNLGIVGTITNNVSDKLTDLTTIIGTPSGADISADIEDVRNAAIAVKNQTDKLTFNGAEVRARTVLNDDKTGYGLSSTQQNDLVDAVWNENLSGHTSPGSSGSILTVAASGSDPSIVADAVWNEPVADHPTVGTTGRMLSILQSQGLSIENELVSGTYKLSRLQSDIVNSAASVIAEVNANEAKIDAILPAITSSKNAVIAEVNTNETKIDSILPAITTAKNVIVAQINANETKIDALDGKVSTLSNNTTVRFIVPERIILPAYGSKVYKFYLRLFDENGVPEAADSLPVITTKNLNDGTVIATYPMSHEVGKIGCYVASLTVSSSTIKAPILVEAAVVKEGITRYIPAVSEITEFESDLTAVESKLLAVESKVDGITAQVTNGVFGLSALKEGQTNIVTEVNANETLLSAIKAKTDTIPAGVATIASVAAVGAAVATKPTMTEIQSAVKLSRDVIMGPGGKNLTQVYNNMDLSTVAKANDPRFSNLDAPVSSRSTLTASQVWSSPSRTLTAKADLTPTEIASIWNYLLSQITTSGSIGKLIKDNLNATVSSRATATNVTSLLGGIAQENTVNEVLGAVETKAVEIESLINNAISKLNAILPKTNLLPTDPASQTALLSAMASISSVISGIDLKAASIKAKTDNIPLDPARNSTLVAVTDPLLKSNDGRLDSLSNLDMPVSSITTPDISGLATRSDVTLAYSELASKVTTNFNKIADVGLVCGQIKSKTDRIPMSPASVYDCQEITDTIGDKIDGIPSGLTASQVWSYVNRSLTQDPTSFGPNISGLAEKSDLANLALNNYTLPMSTVFNTANGKQEVIVWAEKNGQKINGSFCNVSIRNSLGEEKWSASMAAPNSDGIFRFENTLSAPISQNYYMIISMTVDGGTRTSVQSFFTVV